MSAPLPEPPRTSSRCRSYARHLASRPRAWEHDAIRLVIDLCRELRCHVHIVHLSSADALPMIARARDEGLALTVETCPHYLTFAAEEIPDGDPRYKCAPPIRERENRERLWEGLRDGLIDTIGSDHSPAPPELKHLADGDVFRAWGGIASLQVALPAVWTEARQRGFAIDEIATWMASAPAALVGLAGRKGQIAQGYDADLVVFDPESMFTVNAASSIIATRRRLTRDACSKAGSRRPTCGAAPSIARDGFAESATGRPIFAHETRSIRKAGLYELEPDQRMDGGRSPRSVPALLRFGPLVGADGPSYGRLLPRRRFSTQPIASGGGSHAPTGSRHLPRTRRSAIWTLCGPSLP